MSCSITSRLAPGRSRMRSSSGPSASASRCAMPLDGSSSSSTVGPVREDAREVDDAPAAGRQLADELVAEGAEAEQLDELVDARLRPSASESCDRRQVQRGGDRVAHVDAALERDRDRLRDGERGEQPAVLERTAEAAAARARRGSARCRCDVALAEDDTSPRSGARKPGDARRTASSCRRRSGR